MKKLLLFIGVLSSGFASAQVYTSTQNGDFLNPFNWDCTCIPSDGDTLVIAHDMQMTTGIYYTTGQITVNNGASLVEDGTDRDIWVNGGSFINNGTIEARNIWVASGSMENTGVIGPLDSLWVQTPFVNSGAITVYDILSDQTADFNNSGTLTITNNFNNQGDFLNTGEISVANDFSNCNTQAMDAIFTNNNLFCITNDFSNCDGDTLQGSGHYYIGGSSANIGVFDGTHTFHTSSGTVGIEGDIQPGVTVTTGACTIGIDEVQNFTFDLFPNPSSTEINISLNNFSFEVYNYAGILVHKGQSNGTIKVSQLPSGVYWLNVAAEEGAVQAVKFVKQ
jgi:hypothetical protein